MNYTKLITKAIKAQAEELFCLADRVDHSFAQAIELIMQCKGRVIISGMGKSGIICKKIAATFTSTGTLSFFMHPGEAFHGDLGMICTGETADLVILVSYSGETDEVLKLIPSLHDFGSRIIAITGNPSSTLARNVDVVLDGSVKQEVCPNNLAPTSSTIVTLAIGDALAVALMTARDFKSQDFARFHPGGALGRRLLTQVKDVMVSKNLPFISRSTPSDQVILTMTSSRMGVALVMDNRNLIGIVTDGDLRRFLSKSTNLSQVTAGDLMTKNPLRIVEDVKLAQAEELMRNNRVKCLVVVNSQQEVIGLLDWAD